MTVYTLRVELAPNPPMFEPDEEIWCDIEVDETHTLEDLHQAIFDAFDRWDAHMYEFLTYDADGIATRRYVMPQTYSGEPSWPPMAPEEIEEQITRIGAEDTSEETKERYHELQRNPPEEGNTADTTLADLSPEALNWIYYQFDFGDGWEHIIEIEASREGSLDGDPVIVDKQGDAPPQYPEHDE